MEAYYRQCMINMDSFPQTGMDLSIGSRDPALDCEMAWKLTSQNFVQICL